MLLKRLLIEFPAAGITLKKLDSFICIFFEFIVLLNLEIWFVEIHIRVFNWRSLSQSGGHNFIRVHNL